MNTNDQRQHEPGAMKTPAGPPAHFHPTPGEIHAVRARLIAPAAAHTLAAVFEIMAGALPVTHRPTLLAYHR